MGPNAEIDVDVNVDADAAAKELEAKFARAITAAFRSAEVRNAIAGVFKPMQNAMKPFTQTTQQAFKQVRSQAKALTSELTKGFNEVGRAANRAFQVNAGRGASGELQALNAHVATITRNFAQLAGASQQAFNLMLETGRSARAELRAVTQEQQQSTDRLTQSQRIRISELQHEAALVKSNAQVEAATIRSHAQRVTTIYRGMFRLVEKGWDTTLKAARAAARGAGAALAGLGRVTQTLFSSMIRQAQRFSTSFGNAFRNIGRTVTSALAGVSRAIASALRRDENATRQSFARREQIMRSSLSRQQAAAQRAQQIQSRSLIGGLTGGAALGGLAGGAGLFGLLSSGFERFGQQEQLQLTFQTLLRDAPKATAVLQQISDYARTTAFDFTEVAGSVAQLTASLGNVDEAFGLTTFLADVVALTGGTTESLGRVRLAMTQIASAGRLDAANLKQLTESLPGVPFAQILADKFFEGDLQAYAQARDAGELGATITAEAFFDAFEQGVQERFPEVEGFAQTAATTVSGLAANLKENFAIFGATLIGVAEGPIKSFIGSTTRALDVLGQFITGTGAIFGGDGGAGGGEFGRRGVNPFQALAEFQPNALIPFEELPPEMQDILHQRNGWEPNGGFVLAAAHAEDLWEKLHPPPEITEGTNRLRDLRDIVFDFGKGAGVALGLAAAFTTLRLSLVLLLNPLTLLIAAGGALGVLFGKIYDASEPLRNSLSLLRAVLGPLLGALRGLGESLVGGFFRLLGDESTQKGFERIGEFMSGIVNSITRGATQLTEWVTWASEMINLGEGGQVLDDISDRLQTLLGNILGLNDSEISWSKFLGGNDFGNILTTFVEKLEDVPILSTIIGIGRKVIDGLRRIIGSVGGFFTDLWDDIFGGGEGEGGQGGLSAMEERLFGTRAEQASIGTRILNTLEGTFLGPVVRFFRGPFADGVETAVGAVASFFAEGGFTDMLSNVRDFFAPALETIADVIEDVWDRIEPIVQPLIDKIGELVDAFKNWDFSGFDLGNIAAGAGIGAAVGGIFAGIPGLLIGAAVGALSQTGIFGAVVDSINNAWTMEIKPALDGVWENIQGWFSDTFTTDNLIAAAKVGLSGINRLGQEIGRIVGDPLFVGIVAGGIIAVITGAAALVGAFTLGLASGIAENAEQWGQIIGGGLEAAINLIPGLDIDLSDLGSTVADLFTNPVTALPMIAAIAAGLAPIILGGIGQGVKAATTTKGGIATRSAVGLLGLAGGLVAEFGRALTTVVKNQSILAPLFSRIGTPSATDTAAIDSAAKKTTTSLANRMYQAVINPSSGFRNTLRAIGPGIAAIIAGGVTGFAAGRALAGESLLEQIIGVGGLAAGLALLSGPAGLAAGALGILGVVLGNSAQQAERAKERIAELQTVLQEQAGLDIVGGLDEAAAERAISREFRTRLNELGQEDAEAWGQSFADNIDLDRIAQQALDSVPAENALVDYVRNLGDEVVAQGDLTIDEFNTMLDEFFQIAADKDVSFENLLSGTSLGGDEFRAALDSAGVSMGDLLNILGLLRSMFGDVDEAQGNIAWDQTIEGADGAASSIDSVADAVERIEGLLAGGASADEIAAILDTETGGNTVLSLEAVRTAAEELEDQANTTRDAIIEALNIELDPTTLGGLALDFVNAFEGVERELNNINLGAVEGEISSIQVTAATESVKSDVANQILALIQEGLDSGNITTEADAGLLLSQIRQNVEDADLSPEATTLINGVIADMEAALETGDLSTLFDALGTQLTNQQNLADVGTTIANGVSDSMAQGFGTRFDLRAVEALQRLSAPGSGTSTASKDVGENIASKINEGFGGKAQSVVDQGDLVAAGVVQALEAAIAGATSAGQQTGAGFARGLSSTARIAAGVAAIMAAAVVITAQNAASGMYNIGVNAGDAFARGLRSQINNAAAAAAAVAQAAADAARRNLKIASPSQVFVNIGRDVGRGFIQGIKDSEGDMTQALTDALSGAVENAVEKAGAAVRRAQVAGEIFGLLAPSLLPDGTTNAERLTDRASVRSEVFGFGDSLRQATADAIGDLGNAEVRRALDQLKFQGRNVAAFMGEVNAAFRDAVSQRDEITDWGRRLASINAGFRSGALGQQAYNERLREMKEQVATGALSQDSFNDQLKILNNELRLGILNREAFEQARNELGDRPAPLTYEQQQLLRAGSRTLDPRYAQGLANREIILDSLGAIRDWAAEAFNAGRSLDDVLPAMRRYRDSLVNQLESFGFNANVIQSLVESAGLSNEALRQMRIELTSLNQQTVAGANNAANFVEQFVSIREFGQRMLEAGVSASSAVEQMKALRNSIVNQAVAFGFNRTQIQALIEAVGLSDAQLGAFITQLNAFNREAANAEKVASQAAKAAAERERAEKEKEEREAREKALAEAQAIVNRPTIERLIIQVPYGDPEAIALTTFNRVSYGLLTPS